jgi:entericidin B
MKKLLILLATLGLLAACNTVEGVGKDIQKAGDAIEGAAKKAK